MTMRVTASNHSHLDFTPATQTIFCARNVRIKLWRQQCETHARLNKSLTKVRRNLFSNYNKINSNCEVPLIIKTLTVVQCSIDLCALQFHYSFYGQKILFFSDPKKLAQKQRSGKDGLHVGKKNSVKT